jgi:hypothetical protein
MYLKTLFTILGLNLLCFVVAAPLMLRKIPKNYFYGFRVPSTLTHDAVWYDVNEYFGWGFFLASIFSSVASLLLFAWGELSPDAFMNASIFLLILPHNWVDLLTIRYLKIVKRRYAIEMKQKADQDDGNKMINPPV